MTDKLLPTTVVGSYVQPEWLVDRDNLKGRLPPRVRALEMWRIDPDYLEEAQNDATLLAIRDMERAGIDIVTDGEVRRESYSNRVATALGGVDIDNPGTAIDRTGHPNPVPRIAGPITRERPIEVEDVKFLRAATDRKIKITLPGPFTMTQQAQNDHYDTDEAAAMDYAAAVNEEIRDLFAAGADVVRRAGGGCRRHGPRRCSSVHHLLPGWWVRRAARGTRSPLLRLGAAVVVVVVHVRRDHRE